MELVNENTVLEVGKFYNVRCAKIANTFKTFFVPVIGEAHKDAQFKVYLKHYHVDGRFVGNNAGTYQVDDLGRTNNILYLEPFNTVHDLVSEIVIKKRKCVRLTTGIKPPSTSMLYPAWYKTMVGKSCKGKRCPHLGTIMHEREGYLICPLHNLKGDLKTEKIF